MGKVYKTYEGLILAAKKHGYYPVPASPNAFSISFFKTSCDTILYINEVGRWVRQK